MDLHPSCVEIVVLRGWIHNSTDWRVHLNTTVCTHMLVLYHMFTRPDQTLQLLRRNCNSSCKCRACFAQHNYWCTQTHESTCIQCSQVQTPYRGRSIINFRFLETLIWILYIFQFNTHYLIHPWIQSCHCHSYRSMGQTHTTLWSNCSQ